MALWEPPPPIRIKRTLKQGHYVRIAGQAGVPDGERHFISLNAARRYSYSLIQETLLKTEESMSTEIEVQILHVDQAGNESLHEGFVVHAERYLALRERLVGQG
jgi:hypothetical protein